MTNDQSMAVSPQDALDRQYPVRDCHDAPPMKLIEAAGLALENLDTIGTGYQGAAQLARFERDAFDGVRRKAIIGGREVAWIAGWKALGAAVLCRLPCAGHSLFDTLMFLKGLGAKLKRQAETRTLRRALDDGARIERGLILTERRVVAKFVDPDGSEYTYAQVGQDWAQALNDVAALHDRVSEMVLTCLQEGRVLAVEEANGSSVLLTSGQWRNVSTRGLQKRSLYFVLSHQLQGTSTRSLGPRGRNERRQEAEAIRWLEESYAELAPSGRQPTKADTISELVRRFRISKTAAEDRVWTSAVIPLWKLGGRPPDALRYHYDLKEE